MLHEIMATPPAAQAGQDGSLDMATRVPLGTTGIVVTQSGMDTGPRGRVSPTWSVWQMHARVLLVDYVRS